MEVADAGDEGRRPSIEKKPFVITQDAVDPELDIDSDIAPSAFERLPDEIIQQCVFNFSFITARAQREIRGWPEVNCQSNR